jgi:hypothetical protein
MAPVVSLDVPGIPGTSVLVLVLGALLALLVVVVIK